MNTFYEELNADPHGECREEIHMLQEELRRMQEEIGSLRAHSAAAAKRAPVAWIRERDIGKPHPTCISSLAYRSAAEAEDGTTYIAVYRAAAQPTLDDVRDAARYRWFKKTKKFPGAIDAVIDHQISVMQKEQTK